jgi:hypothetical protein
MGMCSICQTENAEANKVCERCGNPLAIDEGPGPEEDGMTLEKKNIQVCPKCRVLYEKGDFCVKCKASLVPKDSLDEEMSPPDGADEFEAEELPQVQSSPDDQEPLFIDPRELEMDVPIKTQNDPPLSQSLPRSSHLWLQDQKTVPHGSRRRSNVLSNLPLALAGVFLMVAVVGYLSTNTSEPSASQAENPGVLVRAVSSAPADSSAQGEEQEIERIKEMLERIRQANLQENIELFMSCYAPDFKGREEKRRSTLESWKHSDYLDLSYRVNSQTVSGDTADVEIEWLIKTSQSINRPPQLNRVVIDASLIKEDGRWRIKEMKTAG